MINNFRKSLCATALMTLTACSPHEYISFAKPDVKIPSSYLAYNPEEMSEDLSAPWWHAFDRPGLNELVEKALVNNQDIRAAVASLRQAQAVIQETSSNRLPQIDGEGDVGKSWRGSDAQNTTRSLGASLSWDIDIFNRIGAAIRSGRFQAKARAEDIEAVKLLLSADVVSTYFEVVSAHRRLNLLNEQLKLDKELQDLLVLRFKNGVGTNVDVLRQKARVEDSEALIPLAEADIALFENRLDVLLGQVPDGQSRVPGDETLDFTGTLPSIGVPAALLLNRPDLRVMQAELIAADADIAAAIAERLPQITLDASYAYSDTAAFSGPVAMIMGAFIQPLLDWGKRKATVERNKALYEEKLAAFTQSYLKAVEDVESALIREEKQRVFIERLQKQRQTLKQSVDASEDRYTEGVDDYLPVIDALQELRRVERDEITEQLKLVNIRIDLHRAIGGPVSTNSSSAGEAQ